MASLFSVVSLVNPINNVNDASYLSYEGIEAAVADDTVIINDLYTTNTQITG